MARRIAESTLNASTLDILNVIRENATYDYQASVPAVNNQRDVVKVGEVLYGHPALANQFINALVNRIALVRVRSATFNNPFAVLKKGYLEFGETIEDVFVNIAKAIEFNVEKSDEREFKRSVPDVRTAFHTMNWRVLYPITIQQEDLRMAFTSINGVQDLIARIVDSVYRGAEYDEYLLFKYLIIKGVTKGQMQPVAISNDFKAAASSYRGISNVLTFMSTKYNSAGVTTNTPREDQYIIMDAKYNAQYDVNVLASAFNMDKATFMGNLMLVDDFSTFDNERFDYIKQNSDAVEDITADELALMSKVKAIIVDKEWFQVYDNNTKFTEKYVASGDYWNYFYHTWKTISSSPFSNAIVFVEETVPLTTPDTITFEVASKDVSDVGTVLTFVIQSDEPTLLGSYEWEQSEELANASVGVQKYGALLIPATVGELVGANIQLSFKSELGVNVPYVASENIVTNTIAVGDTVIFEKA